MNLVIEEIIKEYKSLPQVKAIAFGGSKAAKTCDLISDIDIYVFTTKSIPVPLRENIIIKYSNKYEAGGEYFGSGDEFFIDKINQELDVMYWDVNWFNNIVENIWIKHYPKNGYTTCFLYTLNNFEIIYDPDCWLQNQKNKISTSYPKELKQNIIKRNLMLMKDKPFSSYYAQIETALKRNDINSVNHRTAGFLASYFDVIFAQNELLHPGEKRLIKYAKENCKILPADFEENITKLLIQPNSETLQILDNTVKNLKNIL